MVADSQHFDEEQKQKPDPDPHQREKIQKIGSGSATFNEKSDPVTHHCYHGTTSKNDSSSALG